MFDITPSLNELVGCAIVGTGVLTCAGFGTLFVCLRLSGVLDWHWLWVLSPLLPFAFVVAVLLANAGWHWLTREED